ncbi:TPA: N-acetyl-gamma-glutamyl-phosphate reductase [bacterium]|nr:N-acetyl-gamma-glutamyl-phosphate reductase [bacterium]
MVKVSIIGATGYTGRELIRILLRHKEAEIIHLSADIEEEVPISEIFPSLMCDIPVKKAINMGGLIESDVIFLCLPHRVSMEHVPSLFDLGKKIIDLSADFRLKDPSVYEEWYNTKHLAPHLVKNAVYGLPELYYEKIKTSLLIANPGCYPTSAILGLAPVIEFIEKTSIIIDAKSGISGAGRNPSFLFHFPEANESIKAYSVFIHRHTPEIEQELSLLAKEKIGVTFVPHLIPMDYGILSTIYVRLKEDVDIFDIYNEFYKNCPFIKILNDPPRTKDVVGTNFCLINPLKEKGQLVITSCIDNLIKGASGQAVQNMNVMFGFQETEGLI